MTAPIMNVRPFLWIVALLFCNLFSVQTARAGSFSYGIDAVASGKGPCTCKTFEAKRIGLITNASALTSKGEPSWQVFVRRGMDLRFIMAPEHGFSVDREAGVKVGHSSLADTLKVYSLYGASRKPDPALLKGVDLLVFDLQDVGTRCYTYISTMKLAMEACSEAGIAFVVMDRPNPVAPLPVGGFMLEPAYESFVGAAELPFLHGMTTGEIALWLKKRAFPQLKLRVVKMTGYSRNRFADELSGFRFIAPSPNIRDMETAIIYPATVMLEGTDVSEGRGTEAPFRTFGAPFIDAVALKAELDRYHLPGIAIAAVEFTPASGKFAGQRCSGIRLTLTDRRAFEPFKTSTAILLSLQKLYPTRLGLADHASFFDKLAGTSAYRLMIQGQRPIAEILDAAGAPVRVFERSSPDRFLYP